jgi:hypothetical protein
MTDFTETRSMLKKLAMERGPKTDIGRRCFNILELTDTMPRPPEEWIDYLMPDYVPGQYAHCVREIERQTADLHRLLAA